MRRGAPESRWWAQVDIDVQFYDLDPMDVVWHGNYVKYLEVARCALLERIGYNYTQMRQSGYSWPVIEMKLRYIGPAVFGQKLRLRAELVEHEHRLKIAYLISDAATGKCLNRASTTQVAVNIATGDMCLVSPTILFEKLGVTPP
ncbi:MAG: thioesterase family protein [Telluria sp.]